MKPKPKHTNEKAHVGTNHLDEIKAGKKQWAEKAKSAKTLTIKFTTVSGEPIEMLYTPDDIAHINYLSDIGFPGEYPYTRGIHHNMYRGKLWTMRQKSKHYITRVAGRL